MGQPSAIYFTRGIALASDPRKPPREHTYLLNLDLHTYTYRLTLDLHTYLLNRLIKLCFVSSSCLRKKLGVRSYYFINLLREKKKKSFED